MKNQFQSYCAAADAADARRIRAERRDGARDARAEQSGVAGPDAPRDRPRDDARDAAHDSSRHGVRDDARDARIAVERRLLAALCQGSIAADARGEVMQRLSKHAFSDPEHELIFRALAKIPSGDAEFVRAALGLRLTRAGFPDFDLASFFDAAPPDAAELADILRGFDSL